MGPVTTMALTGVLVTWKGGVELGRERYHDDGKALVSEISLAGQHAKVTITRAPRHVVVEAGGQRVERDVPPSTLVLENGSWQAYALAAEWFPDASAPAQVKMLVPGQGALLDATVQVQGRPGGTRHVQVKTGPLTVEAEVDAAGRVVRASVPLQQLEALPEGQASTPAPPPRAAPAGVVEEAISFQSGGATIHGVLWWPASVKGAASTTAKVPVVVFIAGSGPTDRDGNSAAGLRSDAYRQLAEALCSRGVASLRYDKRGVGASTLGVAGESELRLDHFVDDAVAAATRVHGDRRAGKVTLLGHSEGGLIALVAATRKPRPRVDGLDALILVATAGRPLKDVLREQLATKIPPADLAAFDKLLPDLLAGRPLTAVPPSLAPLLRTSVLPYLRSELSIDPAALAASATVPIAVVQGETDAQVTIEDARRLSAARKDAAPVLLPRVNHVLKEEATRALPQASYSDPSKPLGPGVVEAIVKGVAR